MTICGVYSTEVTLNLSWAGLYKLRRPKSLFSNWCSYGRVIIYFFCFAKYIAPPELPLLLCPGEGKWRRCFSLSPRPHHLVLHCVPENIMRFSSVPPPGISTFFSALCPLSTPATAAKVPVKRAVCLPPTPPPHPVKDALAERKFNLIHKVEQRGEMHPWLIEMIQTQRT